MHRFREFFKIRTVFLSLFPIALSAAFFGFWFKKCQLGFISPDLAHVYPPAYWMTCILFFFLFFILWWLSSGMLFKYVCGGAYLPAFLPAQSLTFLVFTLVPLEVPIKACTLFFLISQAGVVLFFLGKNKFVLRKDLKLHLLALFLMFAVHVFSFSFFSPVFWQHPLASYINKGVQATGAIPTSVPLYKTGYLNAKFFSFSELDPSYWGGVARPLTGVYSLTVPVVTFFLDLPAVDVESYHRLLFAVTWLSCVLGSFGFYLFLFRGIGLSYFVSVFGGILFVFSNQFLCDILVVDYTAFHLYFLVLPFALFLIHEGFKKSSTLLCALSGLVLALPLYILAPHPQAALAALLFYHLYLFLLFFFGNEKGLYFKKLKLILSAEIAAAAGAIAYLAPALDAVKRGELFYFGHKMEPAQSVAMIDECIFAGVYMILLSYWNPFASNQRLRNNFGIFSGIFLVLQFIYVPFLRNGFDRWTGLLAYSDLNFRMFMYYSLVCLILFLFALEASVSNLKKGSAVVLFAMPGLLYFLFLSYSGVHTLKSGQIVNRVPAAAAPKIFWTAYATDMRGLEKDKSSVTFLKKRLIHGEKEILKNNFFPASYRALLKNFGVERVRDLSDGRIADFLRQASSLLDAFYVDNHPAVYPWGTPADPSATQMNHYNNAAVLGGVRSPLQRVLFAVNDDKNVGLAGGLLLNNTLTGIDGRYMAGFPPMHFLYYHPGYDFLRVGNAGFINATGWWMNTQDALSPDNRRILDIAGADVLVVDGASYGRVKNHPDFVISPYAIPMTYNPDYLVLENDRSYGLAYLAQSVRYVNPEILKAAEQNFKLPFYERSAQFYYRFVYAWNFLNRLLLSLDKKHAIILEDGQKKGQKEIWDTSDSTLRIENFIGNRAAFKVHCEKEPCRLVFNTSAIHGWKAFCGTAEIPIRTANFAFLSVAVPKGDHLIWFEHRLDGAVWASFTSLLAYVSVLAILLAA